MSAVSSVVYVLCAVTSLAVAMLLWLNFRRTGFRLLFWSAICFFLLTLNNVMLFLDVVVLPSVDLAIFRTLPAALGFGALLFGFIWETE